MAAMENVAAAEVAELIHFASPGTDSISAIEVKRAGSRSWEATFLSISNFLKAIGEQGEHADL
jgi:hypothetical protein